MSKIEDERVRDNADLAKLDSIEGLYRALVYFQLKIIEHVRISKNSDEAVERADYVIGQMQTVLADMLKESIPDTSDDAEMAASEAANEVREPIALRAMGTHHCPPPHTWDPVTETCV
jgi:hypothetical protein